MLMLMIVIVTINIIIIIIRVIILISIIVIMIMIVIIIITRGCGVQTGSSTEHSLRLAPDGAADAGSKQFWRTIQECKHPHHHEHHT